MTRAMIPRKKWSDAQVKTPPGPGFQTFGKHTHPAIDSTLYQEQIDLIASLDTAPLAPAGLVFVDLKTK